MPDPSASTNWLDVIRSALWPTVALIGFYQFSAPLKTFADNISQGSGRAEEIEVGPIKMKLSVQALRQIVPPSRAVATALSAIQADDLETLLDFRDNTGFAACIADKVPHGGYGDIVEKSLAYKRLQSLGLVIINDSVGQPYSWCPASASKDVSMSYEGKSARKYVLNVLTKALHIEPS